ncbi:hypothetical protein [Catenovulum sediminis]|uniref:Uncharacterized protein n=1 Tax=Catenovulum sediminis TaxID=1740262 RepID=A0ABV1RMH7_9ALTE|nr:hypothetical protein [Catenovulum sediminis]
MNLDDWLLFRFPHLSQHSVQERSHLIQQSVMSCRIQRWLLSLFFISTLTLMLMLSANLFNITLFKGLSGFILASFIAITIEATVKPLSNTLIKKELKKLIETHL